MAARKPAQAALIREFAAKKIPTEKIVKRVKKACGGMPTPGCVRWLLKQGEQVMAPEHGLLVANPRQPSGRFLFST